MVLLLEFLIINKNLDVLLLLRGNKPRILHLLFPCILTLFRMGLFGAAHGWRGAKKPPLPTICRTYPTMIKLDRVIPYPKKIQKTYKSRDTPLEFC